MAQKLYRNRWILTKLNLLPLLNALGTTNWIEIKKKLDCPTFAQFSF